MVNYYAAVLLLRPPNLLYLEPNPSDMEKLRNESRILTDVITIVNHHVIVHSLQVGNLLLIEFFCTTGSCG